MADFNAPKNERQQNAASPKAYAGDEVFFQMGKHPASGRVVATGKHGCTIECGGKQHKVKWEQVAGHKKRAMQRYRVLEQGEDGLIVSDGNGQRRYVGIPPEARGERLALNGKSPRTPGA
jgi:hypothetical protein